MAGKLSAWRNRGLTGTLGFPQGQVRGGLLVHGRGLSAVSSHGGKGGEGALGGASLILFTPAPSS